MSKIVIHGVDVLQCEDDRCEVLRGQDIRIKGNRIETMNRPSKRVPDARIQTYQP